MEDKIAIHRKRSSGSIAIMFPGYNGDIDGYNNKYQKIADLLGKFYSAVLRTDNRPPEGVNYAEWLREKTRRLINLALKDAESICGTTPPEIYLMGISAGASAFAAIAHEFADVKKVLLVAPSADAGLQAVFYGLSTYTGELYITAGEEDPITRSGFLQQLFDAAVHAERREIRLIHDCDHEFRGEVNGRILSRAPFWAFAGDKTFPSPERRIELYK